jgi:hypothetical protein
LVTAAIDIIGGIAGSLPARALQGAASGTATAPTRGPGPRTFFRPRAPYVRAWRRRVIPLGLQTSQESTLMGLEPARVDYRSTLDLAPDSLRRRIRVQRMPDGNQKAIGTKKQ